jgi:hypothetical protein
VRDDLDTTTQVAYIYNDWEIELTFEGKDGSFEDDEPPSYVFYAVARKGGKRIGRIDVVTRAEILPGRELFLSEFHIHGDGDPVKLGRDGLNALAQVIMEDLDVEQISVQGGIRTTGLRPGHAPKLVRFGRRRGLVTKRPS